MSDKVKVSILETNGVNELEGPCERLLTADIVDVNPPINGFDNVDEVLRSIGATKGVKWLIDTPCVVENGHELAASRFELTQTGCLVLSENAIIRIFQGVS